MPSSDLNSEEREREREKLDKTFRYPHTHTHNKHTLFFNQILKNNKIHFNKCGTCPKYHLSVSILLIDSDSLYIYEHDHKWNFFFFFGKKSLNFPLFSHFSFTIEKKCWLPFSAIKNLLLLLLTLEKCSCYLAIHIHILVHHFWLWCSNFFFCSPLHTFVSSLFLWVFFLRDLCILSMVESILGWHAVVDDDDDDDDVVGRIKLK